MNFFELNSQNREELQEKLTEFDKFFTYPLGNDFFQLDHGKDYFKFFELMGEVTYVGYEEDNKIIMVAAGVLRNVNNEKIWYLCDLKVHPDYVGKRLIFKLTKKLFDSFYTKSDKFYGVQMNPSDNKENRVSKLVTKINSGFFKIEKTLNIYSLTYNELLNIQELIKSVKGDISFISHNGVKDLILKSTNDKMPLIHLSFDKTEKKDFDLEKHQDSIFMFSTVKGSELSNVLKENNVSVNATATITQHGMEDFDWEFIKTSDI